jgi:hypothetical protein
MRAKPKPRVRKNQNGRHLYVATLPVHATYGWGNTPQEARAKLTEMLARYAKERSRDATVPLPAYRRRAGT